MENNDQGKHYIQIQTVYIYITRLYILYIFIRYIYYKKTSNNNQYITFIIISCTNFPFYKMPNIFSKMNSNLNLSVNVQNLVPMEHINDYHLCNLGIVVKVLMLKSVVVKDVKSFLQDLYRLNLYIVLPLIVIFHVLI